MTNPTDLDYELQHLLQALVNQNGKLVTIASVKPRLKAIIARECDKARIDELEKMQAMNGWHEGDWKQSMLDRIAQLKAEAAQKGEQE